MKPEQLVYSVIGGESLDRSQAAAVMDFLVSDEATDIQRGSFLTGLHLKGVSAEELIGFSESLRSHSTAKRLGGLTDIVGTGGDGKSTINVSTASAIVASSLGVRIAKHGNTGFTSSHGSADFMLHAGYDFDTSLSRPEETLGKHGFLYAFAPKFNQSFRKFSDVRKRLGHRTVFNLMGPITNPFDPDVLVIGSSDPASLFPYAEVLRGRGKKGMVLHSEDGLDEISPCARTSGYIVDGSIHEITISPAEITGERVILEEVTTKSPEECFNRTFLGISGKDRSASMFIALNTAPALLLNGIAHSLAEGYGIALHSMRSGTAARKLESITGKGVELREAS